MVEHVLQDLGDDLQSDNLNEPAVCEPQFLAQQQTVDCLKTQGKTKSTETLPGMGSVTSKEEASLWDQTLVVVLYMKTCHNLESFQLSDILAVHMVATWSGLWDMVPRCSALGFFEVTFRSYDCHKAPLKQEKK